MKIKNIITLFAFLTTSLLVILFVGFAIFGEEKDIGVVEREGFVRDVEVAIPVEQDSRELSESGVFQQTGQEQSPNFVFTNGDKYTLTQLQDGEWNEEPAFTGVYHSNKYKLLISQNPAGKGLAPSETVKSRTIKTVGGEDAEITILGEKNHLFFVSSFGKGYWVNLYCINEDCDLSEMVKEFDWIIDNLKLE